MSEKPTIHEALSRAMAEVQAVGKTGHNKEQGYNFRGVDAVVNAVGPRLREFGVIPAPMLEAATYRDVTTSRGKPSRECTVQVRYRFYGPAGDFIDTVVPGESMDFGDKGAAKAMSVAYRIALLQLLCIPTGDVEPDSSSYERANEWEQAEKPPTDEQTQVFDGLLAEVKGAATEDDIASVGGRVKHAFAEQLLTKYQYERLARAAAARLADLRKGESP